MNESRAARYQRLRRRTQAAGALSGGALLVVCSLTPAGSLVADWTAAVTAALPGSLGSVARLVLFVSVLVVCWEIATLPALISAMPMRSRRANPAEPVSPRGVILGALVALPAALVVAGAIQIAVTLAGAWWWLLAGLMVAAVLIVVMHAAPGLLARWSGARPVTHPALVERLGALSRQIRVPIESIDELPPGAAATATALVAGGGTARRVFIASELIQDWSDEEIAFVVAHEFAHHAHHDLWKTLALDTVVLAAAFRTADWLAGDFAAAPIGHLAALPFVALVVSVVWVLAAPLRNAVSRRQERLADDFALRLTGSADAFTTALRRLASQHLAEERPSRVTRWLYHRHPSVAERLATAEAFKSQAAR